LALDYVAFRTIKMSFSQKLMSTKGLWEFFKQGFVGTIALLILQWVGILPNLSMLGNITAWTIIVFIIGAIALGAAMDLIVQKV